jgi:DNA-binding IclR family transcriptional regulator
MPGMVMPVNATATGKAIMAFQAPETIKHILSQQLGQFTDNTKTDPQALIKELEAIRKRGYALDLAEHVSGLGTIAFPVHLPRTPVIYAVGLTGPYRQVIESNFEAHCAAIRDTAQRIAKLLQMRGAELHDLSIGSLESTNED